MSSSLQRAHHAIRYLSIALSAITTGGCGGSLDDEPEAARMIELGRGFDTAWDTELLTTGASETSDGSSTTSGSAGGGTWSGGTWSGGTWSEGSTGGGGTGAGETGGETGGGETGAGTEGTCPGDAQGYVKPMPYPAGYPEGWIDKIHLQTGTQCNFQNWVDSDGVDPETPGCHQAYETLEYDPALGAVLGCFAALFPVCSSPTNDVFGEECLDDDILLETNPGKGVCHAHPIGESGVGVGHPDRFSCNAYCTLTHGLPGQCRVADDTCGNGVDSAYCLCGC